MESPTARKVNIIPHKKIKKEKLSEDEEETVLCKVCNKGFVTETALLNHARVQHIDKYMAGEDFTVRKYLKPKRNYTEAEVYEMELKEEAMLSSMEPTDIMTLASNDVSYVIIKSDEPIKKWKPNKIKIEKSKQPKVVKKPRTKREKPIIVQEIKGPFECCHPSADSESPCGQVFTFCCEYSAHCRDAHNGRRRMNKCQICERPLTGSEKIAPNTCLLCGIAFLTAIDLAEHSQTAHVKHKPYECGVCQKRFTQRSGVQQHMRLHTGDRPFPCTYCSKTFTQKSGLELHLRIHTNDKPFTCIICSKKFCQSVHLQQHMRTHTNVAPFQCDVCQKRFKQSNHLFRHMKSHNGERRTESVEVVVDDCITDQLQYEIDGENFAFVI